LLKIVSDNYMYAALVTLIKRRETLSVESLPMLERVVMDADKAKAVLDASRHSMGMDISVRGRPFSCGIPFPLSPPHTPYRHTLERVVMDAGKAKDRAGRVQAFHGHGHLGEKRQLLYSFPRPPYHHHPPHTHWSG
jgi:hypothetical protein